MVRLFKRKKGEEQATGGDEDTGRVGDAAEALEPAEGAADEAAAPVDRAIERTRRTWFSRIGGMFRRGLSDELWEELEETLVAADTGVATTMKVIDDVREKVERDSIRDPEAVVFDALSAAERRDADVVIIDTARRLHTKAHLMEELRKVNRIIQRKYPEAPHEVLLVLDATTGQNAMHQAKYFTEAVGVTGVVLAKLDGTAKGGVIFSICDQLRVPVRFVGTGERPQDLAPFEPREFVEALFAS